MCEICKLANLKSQKKQKKGLLKLLLNAQKEHPWEYLVAPMSEEERRWYDLESRLREER